MLGFNRFQRAKVAIVGIALLHRIHNNQFDLGRLPIQIGTTSMTWDAVLVA